MQLRQEKVMGSMRNTVSGLAWVFGLLLAGSDGNFMPWTNLAGILLFGAAGWHMAANHSRPARKERKTLRRRTKDSFTPSAAIIRKNDRGHGACVLGHSW